MNPTEGLKDEQPGVFDEVFQAGYQEEVVHQHLQDKGPERPSLMTWTTVILPLRYLPERGP